MEELNGDLYGDGLVILAEEGSLEPTDNGNQEQNCNICDNKLCSPRVLSCLHVFCEACIDKLMVNEAGDTLKYDLAVECPICKQETKISGGGAASLPSDYVLTNILDVSAMDQSVVCTCCKSKEPAVARCTDCSHFLCSNCNSAHEFMRCFENHRVVPFDALRSSKEKAAVHKPIFCSRHIGESLKFYCCECEVGACTECLTIEHKVGEHRCERIVDAEPNLRAELRTLITEATARATAAGSASARLDDALGDLQRQRDDAENVINEAFHAYKAALERRREKALEELERLHKERELKVMDLFDRVDKTVQRIDCACKFAARLLNSGDGTEIVMLKKTVASQFSRLLEGAPEFDVDYSVEFVSKIDKFDAITEDTFGVFRTETTRAEERKRASESSAIVSVTSNSHSPAVSVTNTPVFDDFPMGNVRRVTGVGSIVGVPGISGVPIGVPGVGPVANNIPGVGNVNVNNVSGVGGVPGVPAIQCASMVEYNLQQLASIAEKDVPPPPHASPAPAFTLAELLAQDLNSPQVYNNLQALAKLGLNSEVNGFGGVGGVGVAGMGGAGGRGVSPGRPLLTAAEEAALVAPPAPLVRATKATPMHIRFKFGQLGGGKGQFNSPHGFCLGNDEDIIVADTNNHRITVFDKSGNHKFNFGVAGKEEGQLWYPRKVAVVRATGKFVVCDRGNERSRMQIFTKNGHFLKKIAVRFIDIVAGLAVTAEGLIVAVDSVTPTVFILSEEGDLMSWFDCSECMREPSDIAISGKEFYVCDFKGHCVVVFDDEGHFLRRIGCENVTNFPNGIDVSDAGDVLIGDSHGNKFHVAVFSRDGVLVTEFECPYVKVHEVFFLRRIGCENVTNFPNGIDVSDAGDVLIGDSHGNKFHVAVFSRDGVLVTEFECPYVKVHEVFFLRRIGCENVTNFPNGIDVSDAGDVLIGDSHGNKFHVAVFSRDGVLVTEFECPYVKVHEVFFLRRIGCENVTNFPNGIDVSDAGDVLIGDSHGNKFHVAVFSRDGVLVTEFECPYVKVHEVFFLRRIGCENVTNFPNGIDVSDAGDVLIGDSHGNKFHVAVFSRDGVLVTEFECPYVKVHEVFFLRRIGCENVTNFPNGIDVSDAGDVLIGDSHGNKFHVAVFSRDGVLVTEFECPYVKVHEVFFLRRIGCENVTNFPNGIDVSDAGDVLIGDSHGNKFHVAVFSRDGVLVTEFECPYVKVHEVFFLRRIGCENVTNFPNGIDVSDAGDVLIGDSHGNKFHVAVFSRDGVLVTEFECPYVKVYEVFFLRRIGCENVTNFPNGIDVSDAGDVLIGDSHGNKFHVAVFSRDGVLVTEFECPYVKVHEVFFLRRIGCENVTNFPNGIDVSDAGDVLIGDSHGNKFHVAVFSRDGVLVTEFECPYVKVHEVFFLRRIGCENVTNFPNGIDVSDAGDVLIGDSHGNKFHVAVFSRDGVLVTEFECPYVKVHEVFFLRRIGCENVTNFPNGIDVSDAGDVLIGDSHGNKFHVAVFSRDGVLVTEFECPYVKVHEVFFLRRIGCENVTNFPNGIDVSDAGDVLIGDSHGNKFHVAVFSRDGVLVTEFECPYVKVSRCCGLKITSEGYIVTLAKNNHHVLVLNTLYIV